MNQDSLFSEHWYRLKDLKPRLASDVTTCLHIYRKIPCYVLHRRSTGAYHRLDARTYSLIADLDGGLTINEAWQRAMETQNDNAPTQTEFMSLLARLHEAELLTVNRKLDAEQLFSRAQDSNHRESKQRYLNPLFLRFRICDPDRFLDKLRPLANRLFTRTALALLISLIVVSLFILLPRLTELRYELVSSDVFSAANLMLLFLLYPALKLVHELAHGLAVKRFGGEVHELGMALMVFLPIPYVDASAASALPDKWNRMLISAAGIFAELAIAAVATIVWSFTSGTVHDAALTLMLIGSVSTLLFNGNPLLKFDGYYILSDALEIPNLADRSKQYLLALAKRCLYDIQKQEIHLVDPTEGIWLVFYGTFSTMYKLVIMSAIALTLSEKYFVFGTLMTLWIAAALVGTPLYKWFKFVMVAPQPSRLRSIFSTLSVTAVMFATLGFMPFPLSTVARGVVWLPENALVRVHNACEITQTMVEPGASVKPGDALLLCEDHDLNAERLVLKGKLAELNAVRMGLDLTDRVGHEKVGHEIETIQASLQHVVNSISRQVVKAESTGQFHPPANSTLQGQFLASGALVAYVVPSRDRTVRVAIEQADATWFQHDVPPAEIQFDEQGGRRQVYASRIYRQTPKSTTSVASAGLTTAGGGRLVADPAGDGRTVLEPVFDIELAWPDDAPDVNVGSHVSVVFRHAPSTLLNRIIIAAQRSLLGRLDA